MSRVNCANIAVNTSGRRPEREKGGKETEKETEGGGEGADSRGGKEGRASQVQYKQEPTPPPSTKVTTSKCRPKKPHGPNPPFQWAQGLCLARGSQRVHGARGSPSSTAPLGPFARSLLCPGCIGVCVEGFIRVAAVVGILFSARTRGFPCSFVGSVRRHPRARPAPAPKCPACLLPPRRCLGSWHRAASSAA